MSTLHKAVVTAVTAAALLGTVATSTPAQAATSLHCQTTSHTFALPGKPDVKVGVQLCVERTYVTSDGYRHYKAWINKVSWDGTSSWYIGGDRFNDFSILPRLEHGTTRVEDCDYGICGYTQAATEINKKEKGSYNPKYSAVYVKTKKKTWTADGYVLYDVSDDGKPTRTWQLSGTAAVS